MATVISSETVRATCKRITWQWVDGQGLVHGPFVAHIPTNVDNQTYVNAQEQADIDALAASELMSNMEEIAS